MRNQGLVLAVVLVGGAIAVSLGVGLRDKDGNEPVPPLVSAQSPAPESSPDVDPGDESTANRQADVERPGDGETAPGVSAEVWEFDRISAELRDLRARGVTSQNKYRPLLKELVALGTDEAIELALELMSDHDFRFSHKASSFLLALGPIEDPRIADAVKGVIEYNVENGLTSAYESAGYFSLLATKGGAEAADILCDMIEQQEGAESILAAMSVGDLADHSRGEQLLSAALAKGRSLEAVKILEGLAAWREESVSQAMEQLVYDEAVPVELRTEASQSIGRFLAPEKLDAFLAQGALAATPEDREVAVYGLFGIAGNRELDKATLPQKLSRNVILNLRDESTQVVGTCLSLLSDYPALATEEVRVELEALKGAFPDDKRMTQKVKRVLAKL